jgi:antitoxin VapB
MAFHISDQETEDLVRELARKMGVGLTEAVKLAVRAELEREDSKKLMLGRIREIQDQVALWPRTGLKADKAFFDELSGDTD